MTRVQRMFNEWKTKPPCNLLKRMVGDKGLEPLTSPV